MAVAADEDEVTQYVGLQIEVVDATHVAKGAKGAHVMNIVFTSGQFFGTALGTAKAITFADLLPLLLPIGAIVVD